MTQANQRVSLTTQVPLWWDIDKRGGFPECQIHIWYKERFKIRTLDSDIPL